MAIKVFCVKCGKELDEPGGLLFSPLLKKLRRTVFSVEKLHVCYDCWIKLEKWMRK